MTVDPLFGPFSEQFGARPIAPVLPRQQGNAANQAPRYPSLREMKLTIEPFEGKEAYPGLGSDFLEWGLRFLGELRIAEGATGVPWPEDVKIDRLGRHLRGTALAYYNASRTIWWNQNPTLDYALERMNDAYTTILTPAEAMMRFIKRKGSE